MRALRSSQRPYREQDSVNFMNGKRGFGNLPGRSPFRRSGSPGAACLDSELGQNVTFWYLPNFVWSSSEGYCWGYEHQEYRLIPKLHDSPSSMGAPCSPGVRGPKKPGAAPPLFLVSRKQWVIGRKHSKEVVFGTTYAGANVGHPSGSVRRLDLLRCWEHDGRRDDGDDSNHTL
jgi:hypothetical protein